MSLTMPVNPTFERAISSLKKKSLLVVFQEKLQSETVKKKYYI